MSLVSIELKWISWVIFIWKVLMKNWFYIIKDIVKWICLLLISSISKIIFSSTSQEKCTIISNFYFLWFSVKRDFLFCLKFWFSCLLLCLNPLNFCWLIVALLVILLIALPFVGRGSLGLIKETCCVFV